MRRPKKSCCVRQLGGGVRRPPGPLKTASTTMRPSEAVGRASDVSSFLVACENYVSLVHALGHELGYCIHCGQSAEAHGR